MTKEKKQRVLIIVPLPPPVHGSTVMAQYIKDSKLINNQYDCDYINITTSNSTSEIGKFSLKKIWHVFSELVKEFVFLLTRRYSFCYAAISFKRGLFKDALFVLLCKLFGKKVVIHLHGKGASKGAENRYYKQLLKLILNDNKVILLSWLLYPDVEQFVKRENVYVCPNGIPIVTKDYQERHHSIPNLLFLSNLIESKGVIVLLDALKVLASKGYKFHCDFVGGESADINIIRFEEEVRKRGLVDIVCYQGKKFGKEKDEALKNCDIFVFPTFYENECFPLVLLEAMQYGLPIVTTNEGAIADIVKDGENGYICERRDAYSLAECISKLISNEPLRWTFGKSNYEKFHKSYTIGMFEMTLNAIFKLQSDTFNN